MTRNRAAAASPAFKSQPNQTSMPRMGNFPGSERANPQTGLGEASPLCEWDNAVVCHTGLSEISPKTFFHSLPAATEAGLQDDPNPVIGTPTVLSAKSTVTGALGGEKAVLSDQTCHCSV